MHITACAVPTVAGGLLLKIQLPAACCCCCCCQVRVVRCGAELTLSCFELLVGDVLLVEAGDILPADGLLYAGGQLKCVDEAAAAAAH
jgi:magnesium-transporting ATPase (P-type)